MEFKEYIEIIRKKLWIIIITCLVSTMSTAIYGMYFQKNIYESNTTLYIGKQNSEQNALAYNDLLMGQSLVKDYRELAKSRTVAQQVVNELKKEGKLDKDISPLNLASHISVNLRGDTRIIEIKVQDKSPERARDLANKVAQVFKVKVKELMNIDFVEIIDTALLPDINKPVKPKRAQDITIAVFIGIMAGLGVAFLLEYLDNTIKTSEDAEKYLELPVIGTIPVIDNGK